jgi:Cu/Ag efflux pump CusA
MTALAAALGLLPLALSLGQPGKELLQPIAVVILGGLLSSTLLDQMVTPTLYSLIGGKEAEREQQTESTVEGEAPLRSPEPALVTD